MRYKLFLPIVLMPLWLAFGTTCAAASSEFHALLIANSEYQDPGWGKLKTPQADAEELQRVLRDQYGFQTEILSNATRSDIIDRIEVLKTQVDEDDSLLIYFAGHGILREDGGYWVGIDASVNSRSRWLKYATINDLIDHEAGMKARHVMVVADSCYSGVALRKLSAEVEDPAETRTQLLARKFSKRSRRVITSGGVEPVLDGVGGSRHSVFAAELIDKLETNRAVLDAKNLFQQIEPEVFGRARRVLGGSAQAPEYGRIPGVGHNGGDFVFVPTGMSVPNPSEAATGTPQPFGLRGPTTIVHNMPGPVHLGDQPIPEWDEGLHGACYDVSFDYPDRIDHLTLRYDVYGAHNTFVSFNGIIQPFESMPPRQGDRWSNYWSNERVHLIPVGGQSFPGRSTMRICSELVPEGEFSGDLDDFRIRNLSVQIN